MKIMLDTNVLISAIVFGGRAYEAVDCLLRTGHRAYVSAYVDKEFRAKIAEKWKMKAEAICAIYDTFPFIFCPSTSQMLGTLRDKKDIPVLSDAIYNKMDILLTGDKDFLESGIEYPKILSPSMLLDILQTEGNLLVQ